MRGREKGVEHGPYAGRRTTLVVCVIRTPPHPLAPPPRPSPGGLKSRRTRTTHPPLQPEGGRKSEGDSNGSLQKRTPRYESSRLYPRTLNAK